MNLEDGSITILINQDYATIEIRDDNACTTFVKVTLTPEQLSCALSRLSKTECKVEVFGLDRVGKKHEHKSFEFEVSEEVLKGKGNMAYNCAIAMNAQGLIDEGWISDNYYGSQNSYFTKDGKKFARTIIRRYV